MSQKFYVTVIGLLTAYGAFFTYLHYREIALIDATLKCLVTAGLWV